MYPFGHRHHGPPSERSKLPQTLHTSCNPYPHQVKSELGWVNHNSWLYVQQKKVVNRCDADIVACAKVMKILFMLHCMHRIPDWIVIYVYWSFTLLIRAFLFDIPSKYFIRISSQCPTLIFLAVVCGRAICGASRLVKIETARKKKLELCGNIQQT